MYLKKLEMQGFKSFVDKISLDFGGGITAIVGPNGSGKSNISDAIRWVMGEQSAKSLRGSKMEDVIFAGTEKRKATGFAEVSLILDNSKKTFPIDYDEITVTRRVYRSGESEYLINKAVCRLRDIYELFMDTGLGRDGYSIIGQGRIDEILSNKSEDRRQVFEEAAGISKYRYRKTEAERKLSATDENLARLMDIKSELEARLEPLKNQSEKAQKYLNLRDKLRVLDVNLSIDAIEKCKKFLEDTESVFKNTKNEAEESLSTLKELQDSEEVLYGKLRETDGVIDEIRERLHGAEILGEKTKGEISLLNNKIITNEEEISRLEGEISELLTSNEDCGLIVSRLEEKIEEAIENRKKILGDIEKANECLNTISAEADKLNSKINALLEQKADKNHLVDVIKGKIATIEALEGNADERIAAIKDSVNVTRERYSKEKRDYSQIGEQIEIGKKELLELQKTREAKLLKARALQQENENLKKEYNIKSEEYNRKSSRLAVLSDMEKNMEGYSVGVKALLTSELPEKIDIHGVLSKLITVDDKYSLAVETALANALQNIVVGSEEDAKKAIAYLKENRLGRATFLPLTSVTGRRGNFESKIKGEKGSLGLVCDFVECDGIYRDIVENLLGQTALFDNIDNAIAAAKKFEYRFKIVTLGGEVIFAGGSITGGSYAKNSRLLGREKEIRSLSHEVDTILSEMDKTEDKIDKNTDLLRSYSESLEKMASDIAEKNNSIIKLASERDILRHVMERESEELKLRETELDLIISASKNSAQEKEKLNFELSQAEIALEECEGEAEKARLLLREQLHLKEKQAGVITEYRMSVSEINSDIDMMKMQVANNTSQQDKNCEQIRKYEESKALVKLKIEEIKKMMVQKQADADEAVKRAEEFVSEIEQKSKLRGETDDKMLRLKSSLREQNERVNQLNLEVTRLENKMEKAAEQLDTTVNRLWEDYDLTYSEAVSLKIEVEDKAEAKREAARLRNSMKSLGNVNLDAINEYKEVSERYEFLSTQTDDLNRAKKELNQLIDEMTKCMTERFAEQFEIISDCFSEVFAELFGGGSATLSLTDPANILESGIDIEVRPPGKKLQRLSLLSGGEMAFTAIALLFAILKVRPTPFCILDEIEAALDDNNIARFADYVKRFSDETQFIVVTHRRGTMEAADILYGVTMQEKGVSKLLSMKLDEVKIEGGEDKQ